MDIQGSTGFQNEESSSPAGATQVCPECQAQVASCDRFCQECGARVSISRVRKTARRAFSAAEPQEVSGPACVICINCGTTNQALSAVCSDCRIPLVPALKAKEDAFAQKSRLRGSLQKTQSTRPNANLESGKRTTANEEASTETSVPTTSTVVPLPDIVSDSSDATRAKQNSAPASDIGETPELDDTSSKATPDSKALDFLFPDSGQSASSTSTFDRLIHETRKTARVFSITSVIVFVESLFEMIPAPLIFLFLSLVIISVTATVTTQWNRSEQRLLALDRIAANAEEDMRAYRLDVVIKTMDDLETTEKGDLPPRARAVLNQSLWLRAYAQAKKLDYAKAIADLSRVTPEFVSYEDVTDKLAEYKKMLAKHPEFSSVKGRSAKMKAKLASKQDSVHFPAEGAKTIACKSAPDQSSKIDRPQEPRRDKKASLLVKTSNSKKSDEARINRTDRDAKRRYEGLLVDYFSRASEGKAVAEPPSFEEWSSDGRQDF